MSMRNHKEENYGTQKSSTQKNSQEDGQENISVNEEK
jgi:hypothetical protein